jgi:hypothetical protein
MFAVGSTFLIESWYKFLSLVASAVSVILGEIPSPGKNSYKQFQLLWVKSHRSGKTYHRVKPKPGRKPEWSHCNETGKRVTLAKQPLLCLCYGNGKSQTTSYSLQTFCTSMTIIFGTLNKLPEVMTLVTCRWEVDLNNYCPAWNIYDLPQSLQWLELFHVHVLSRSFEFAIHQSSCHSAVYDNVSYCDSVVTQTIHK